ASQRLAEQAFDLLVLDLVVSGMRGSPTLQELRRAFPDLKIAILTGQSLSDDALEEVLRLSDAFVEKPFQVSTIIDTARKLLQL
ncbi:response regulator, partial [Planctomycetota bacterium]